MTAYTSAVHHKLENIYNSILRHQAYSLFPQEEQAALFKCNGQKNHVNMSLELLKNDVDKLQYPVAWGPKTYMSAQQLMPDILKLSPTVVGLKDQALQKLVLDKMSDDERRMDFCKKMLDNLNEKIAALQISKNEIISKAFKGLKPFTHYAAAAALLVAAVTGFFAVRGSGAPFEGNRTA